MAVAFDKTHLRKRENIPSVGTNAKEKKGFEDHRMRMRVLDALVHITDGYYLLSENISIRS